MSAILVLQNNETAAMLVFPSQFCKSWTFLYMSCFLRRDIYAVTGPVEMPSMTEPGEGPAPPPPPPPPQGEGLDLSLGMIKF